MTDLDELNAGGFTERPSEVSPEILTPELGLALDTESTDNLFEGFARKIPDMNSTANYTWNPGGLRFAFVLDDPLIDEDKSHVTANVNGYDCSVTLFMMDGFFLYAIGHLVKAPPFDMQ